MKWKKKAKEKPKIASKTSEKTQDGAVRNEKLLRKARIYLGNIIKVCVSNVYEHFFSWNTENYWFIYFLFY